MARAVQRARASPDRLTATAQKYSVQPGRSMHAPAPPTPPSRPLQVTAAGRHSNARFATLYRSSCCFWAPGDRELAALMAGRGRTPVISTGSYSISRSPLYTVIVFQ